VAVIPIYGVISQRQNLMAADSGGTSIEGVTNDFRDAMADPEVDGIVFDFDSPGGTIDGVAELADEIRAARGTKPVAAQANGMAASAAYWLAAAAEELVVTPSGSVGSIGVFTAHEDLSVQAEADGIKTTLISAGKYKTEGNPWEPLSEEARANLQEMVDTHYGMMVSAIAKGRGAPVDQIRSGYGQGRLVLAKKAAAEGMVDRIDTLDNTIARVGRGTIGKNDGRVAATSWTRFVHADDTTTTNSIDAEAPVTGQPFVDRLALVTAEAESLLAHAQDRTQMRAKEGRGLTGADRSGLRAIAVTLSAIAGVDPDPEPAPDPPADWATVARLRVAKARAEYRIE
jgi:signal peptide peptidase SppA